MFLYDNTTGSLYGNTTGYFVCPVIVGGKCLLQGVLYLLVSTTAVIFFVDILLGLANEIKCLQIAKDRAPKRQQYIITFGNEQLLKKIAIHF